MHLNQQLQTVGFVPNAVMMQNGKAVTTSRVVAEVFGKLHKNVLRDIATIECSQDFNELNFEPVNYKDAKGETRPEYIITRDGFTFLAMGFTGRAASRFKEQYISAFNKMEQERVQLLLKTSQSNENELLQQAVTLLSTYLSNKAALLPANHNNEVTDVNDPCDQVKWSSFLPSMQIGDSVLLPRSKYNAAKQYLFKYGRKTGWKFSIRVKWVPKGKIRITRVNTTPTLIMPKITTGINHRYNNLKQNQMQEVEEITKIDSNVPPPSRTETNRGKLNLLEIGDSFSLPRAKVNSMSNTISIHFHGATNKRFTISVKDQPKSMARVWRIEDATE